MHSYGIVHRDLKLENIMMSDNSENAIPKLVDFGLAKMIGPNGSYAVSFGPIILDSPKSTIFSYESSESSTIKMFSSFKSL